MVSAEIPRERQRVIQGFKLDEGDYVAGDENEQTAEMLPKGGTYGSLQNLPSVFGLRFIWVSLEP